MNRLDSWLTWTKVFVIGTLLGLLFIVVFYVYIGWPLEAENATMGFEKQYMYDDKVYEINTLERAQEGL